jgi:hypothetical protein
MTVMDMAPAHHRMGATRVRRVAAIAAILMAATAVHRAPTAEVQRLGPPVRPPADAGTATISGIVTEADGRTPVGGARVYLGPPGHGPPDTPLHRITGPDGMFVFERLPAFSAYYLTARNPGYVDGQYGGAATGQLGGALVELAEGQAFADAQIRLTRTASVSGVVLDPSGQGVPGVFVRVLRRLTVAGRDAIAAGPATQTDERGTYRIADLAPGTYLVQVPSVQNALPLDVSSDTDDLLTLRDRGRLRIGLYPAPPDVESTAYRPTFYPGVPSMQAASLLELGAGDDREAVDIALEPVPAVDVGGRLLGPPEAWQNLTVRLVPPGAESLGEGSEVATALVGDGGSFRFVNVPRGEYVLDARRAVGQLEYTPRDGSATLPRPPGDSRGSTGSFAVRAGPPGIRMRVQTVNGSQAFFAQELLSVDQHELDVTMPLLPTAVVGGRFIWDGEPPSGLTFPAEVLLEPAGGDASFGMPSSRPPRPTETPVGTFRVEGVLPGEYVLRVRGRHRIKAVTLNGQDYVDAPLAVGPGEVVEDVEVTLTGASNRLIGTVTHDTPAAEQRGVVVVFPSDRTRWINFGFSPTRLRAVPVTTAGRFEVTDIPAGEYQAVVIAAEDADSWFEPAFLERVRNSGVPFTIGWSDEVTLNLRLARPGR